MQLKPTQRHSVGSKLILGHARAVEQQSRKFLGAMPCDVLRADGPSVGRACVLQPRVITSAAGTERRMAMPGHAGTGSAGYKAMRRAWSREMMESNPVC